MMAGMGEVVAVAVIVAMAIGAAIALRGAMSGASTAAGQFRRYEAVPVGDVAAGEVVHVVGVVRAVGEPPVSEVSGRAFVARDLRITTNDGDGGHPARPARQVVDFMVDDGTGAILVRGDGALVAIERDAEMPATTLDQAMWLDPLLRASGYHNGSPATCKVRVREGVIGVGDRVGVVGLAVADPAAAAVDARLVLTAGRVPVAIRVPPPA